MLNSHLSFTRNIILVQNNRFRTSQLLRIAASLPLILKTTEKFNKTIHMKRSILSIILLVFITNISCSQEKNVKELDFKNSIESSIESSSESINPLIKKIYTILNDGDIDSFSITEYDNCKSTIVANKKFVIELVEVDDKINLKHKTIKYLESVEKILDEFILPIIKHLNEPNQTKVFDMEKLKKGLLLIQTSVNETSDLNNSLDSFCIKYKLSKKMNEFDKKEFTQKIEELKSKLKN